MRKLSLFSRTATTFSKEGGIDEDALRQSLQRFVDAKVGVYLASAGSGEGNALTEDELRRVYRIGVEVKFTDGLLRLRIPEIDELSRAGGLAIPS